MDGQGKGHVSPLGHSVEANREASECSFPSGVATSHVGDVGSFVILSSPENIR